MSSPTLIVRAGCVIGLVVSAIAVAMLALKPVGASEPAVVLPLPAVDLKPSNADGEQVVVLAGGCFWGVQAVYQHTRGVTQALSGYAGGTKETAIYDLVSRGRTRHAEAVQIRFDPKQISYGKILQIFFSVVHDPTQLDRQGPDIGAHYRSAIFYADAEQKRVAESYIRQLDGLKVFKSAIVTRMETLEGFYPAEEYHQDYAMRNPTQPYIVHHDLPKIDNLKSLMPDVYRETPVLVTSILRKRASPQVR